MVQDDAHPKKRRRKGKGASQSSSNVSGDTTSSYLTCFDETKPIAIVMSPLRRGQGAILARNLRDAGAHVIEDFKGFETETGSLPHADVVVVTDEKSRAEDRMGEQLSAFRSLQYVSTNWASDVLSAQSPIPVESYLLEDRSSQVVADKENKDAKKSTTAMVRDETQPREQRGTRREAKQVGLLIGGNTSSSYLTCFDETKPIAIVVSPLKRHQGAILARNLRDAGANVIEDFKGFEKEAGSPAHTDIVIVTDEKSRAEDRMGGQLSAFRSLQYVSTKWASKVLSTQSPIPVESYLLGSSSSQLTAEGGKKDAQKSTTPFAETPFLPVWCDSGVRGNGDVAERHAILRRLPSYLCERSTITQSIYPCPNKDLCSILEQMAKKRVLERAGGSNVAADIRARAYHLASSALKCVPFELKTQQDAQTLHTFGPRVLAVVNEYLTTGDVHEVSELESDPRLRTLSKFQDMYGVGATSARDLYDLLGIKSVEQLRERVRTHSDEFSPSLVDYLRYYDNLGRMDLKGAVAFKQLVEDVVNEAGQKNLHLRFVLCGGFRRGEPSGHDVDLLYCRRRERDDDHTSILDEVVKRLLDCGLLVCVLSLATKSDGWHERRYLSHSSRSVFRYGHDVLHGLAKFAGRVFRLDIVGVRDAAEFAFATLAWSGSTVFQRDIRHYCEKKGWIFNHHGLFERAGGQRVELRPVPKSEVDVFAAMGLTYRPPFERSC